MNLFSHVYDDLSQAIDDAGGLKNMTIEQRLQAIQIKALLSLSQELSLIQDQGIQPDWSPRND